MGWSSFGHGLDSGPHPRIKSGAGSSPLPPSGRGDIGSRSSGFPWETLAGARLLSHRRVSGLRANWLMVDKKGPAPPTSPDRRPSGRRNDVAARHHLVLQPRVSTVAVSARRSGGDLCGIEGAIVSDLERASPAAPIPRLPPSP